MEKLVEAAPVIIVKSDLDMSIMKSLIKAERSTTRMPGGIVLTSTFVPYFATNAMSDLPIR